MATKPERCRLVRGEIHDFMKVRFVEIRFGDDPIIPIRGENEQGKTSVLRAFIALLGGKEASPEKPIRDGAESAQVVAELDNGLVIRRRWTRSGNSYLDVQTREGATFRSPQKILDDLVGRFTLDPLEFDRMDAKKQVETLRKISGVDLAPLDAKRQQAYDARTLANRDVATAKARLAAAPEVEAPSEPVSAAALLEELRGLQEQKAANDKRRAALRRYHDVDFRQAVEVLDRATVAVKDGERRVEAARAALEEEERKLAASRALLDSAHEAKDAASAAGNALLAEVKALVDPDTSNIEARIREVDAVNERVRAKRARGQLAGDLATAEVKAKELDDAVAAAEDEKRKALADAKFPVEGLGFDAENVTVDGVPYKQASQARRVRISMAMALALRPRLPLVCITNGSLLDARSSAIVREMAVQAGAQILLELVGKEGAGVVLEDGEVVGAVAPAEAAHVG